MIKEHDTSWMTDKQYAYYCQIKNNMIQIKNSAHQSGFRYSKKEVISNAIQYDDHSSSSSSSGSNSSSSYGSTSSSSGRVQVKSYTRKNGTVVKAHSRSAPRRR
jgi:hypothetical protein